MTAAFFCLSSWLFLPTGTLQTQPRQTLDTFKRNNEHNLLVAMHIDNKDRLPSKELRERLGVDDIALVLQQNRLRWYGHVLRKDDDDWVKKCMEHEAEGSRPRGRPKKTWKEVVREDCKHVS